MCSSCHEHVLADAMLKDSTASCPSCRVDLNRHSCTRNLAVEKAVAELLTLCSACNQEMARSDLIEHQKKDCVKRYADIIVVAMTSNCDTIHHNVLIEHASVDVNQLVVTGKDVGASCNNMKQPASFSTNPLIT